MTPHLLVRVASCTWVQVYRRGMDEVNESVSAGGHGGVLAPEVGRLGVGASWGAAATVVMGLVMLAAVAGGISPMPMPIPAALVSRTIGVSPGPGLIVLAVLAHLAYGAAGGAVLAGLVRRVTVWRTLGYGVALWALMGLVWLPYLGWGVFGTAVTPKVAVATLVLHLIYGLVLGLLLARRHRHTDVSKRGARA